MYKWYYFYIIYRKEKQISSLERTSFDIDLEESKFDPVDDSFNNDLVDDANKFNTSQASETAANARLKRQLHKSVDL